MTMTKEEKLAAVKLSLRCAKANANRPPGTERRKGQRVNPPVTLPSLETLKELKK